MYILLLCADPWEKIKKNEKKYNLIHSTPYSYAWFLGFTDKTEKHKQHGDHTDVFYNQGEEVELEPSKSA